MATSAAARSPGTPAASVQQLAAAGAGFQLSCRDLDADFAAQRIKKPSFFEAFKSALFNSASRKHRTLVYEFAYPHCGDGTVYQEMAERVRALGGEILLNKPVASVHPALDAEKAALVTFNDGETKAFDHVISTMPITQLVDRMGAPEDVRRAAGQLRLRNTILVCLRVDAETTFPDQWIYVHSPDLLTGRTTNFRNWVPSITNGLPDAVLCLEYWCYDGDDIWTRSNADLVGLATNEVYKTSLVATGSVKDGHVVRIPKCYPVYNTGYKKHLEPVQAFLSQQHKISVIRRYGAFKYNNQDHSILMGYLAAENIADGAQHDLWAINTDYEYQEASRISATGLSPA